VAQPAEETPEVPQTGDMKLGRRKPTETQSVQQLSQALEPGHSENAEIYLAAIGRFDRC
jgi:hypothetical protein